MDVATNWKPQEYMFDQTLRLEKDNYKLIDHPADNYIDYNSMVDNLEEEHMRRDVFTTAIETTAGANASAILAKSTSETKGPSRAAIKQPEDHEEADEANKIAAAKAS